MDYVIVMDSCGELTRAMKEDERVISAPLTLRVDDFEIIDDESFDQADFLARVAKSPEAPKSACPSPEFYRESFARAEKRAYAVTLSAELSGSYNSALLASTMIKEERPDLEVYVFNSKSASIGETLITDKIMELEAAGLAFEELIAKVEEYIDSQHTYFVLESLEALRKNGRLSNVKAFLATALKIKPVMGSTETGNIMQLDQARGINKALVKMVDYLVEREEHPEDKILAISHCNCPQRGEMVRDAILSRIKVKDVILLDTAGVSSLYASDGGIIAVI